MEELPSSHPDSRLLQSLKAGDPGSFDQLYRKYYRMVADLVLRNGGSGVDSEDVFQECLFVLVKKLQEPDFTLTGKLSTYLFAVARNIWFKRRKDSSRVNLGADEASFELVDQLEIGGLSPEEVEQLYRVMEDSMRELEPDCQQVIELSFMRKLSQAEIAGIMDYSKSFVKVKKFRCLEYLRKIAMEHPLFKNL